ncbi:probable beta-D-xylosidase 7 [Oryza glaberrima]|uniref:probable beta-D-xylosidase 7 n=1 Tax=Oryza glaberrima TaxID=4538 RepID=UPI00224C18F7|nr:probable beta-D-xylosidase 7 [Oryza glaberrima]
MQPRVAMADELPYSCGPPPPPSSSLAAQGQQQQPHRFCDERLTAEQRAADLVANLTLAEKVSQLGDRAAGVARLGVPAYEWWSEGLHGLSIWGRGIRFNGTVRAVTSFPQVILTAAAFDAGLWRRVGEAVGAEARALYNLGQANGLTIWSPNVNIFRDPRWGRGQETPGEDPVTASRYAVAFVTGLQGIGGEASACCKHATAYDLDYWNNVVRYNYDSKVTLQDLEDTYNPPFKSCVAEGKATCIMCGYNSINGVPACASSDLLTKKVRQEWGMNGYVASDCDAVATIRDAHHYTLSPEDTVAVSIKAGMDVNCGNYTQVHAMAAVQKGNLTEKDIDRALVNLFAVRMRLGHFDGDPRSNAVYGHLGAADVCSPAHKSLALEAAQDGIVLLKNDAGALPLQPSAVTSLAVIGPNADNLGALHGNYFGPPCETTTPLQGIKGYLGDRARFLAGCDSPACAVAATNEAAALASSSDHVVLFMGLSQKQEQEGLDKTSLLLPGEQQGLITAVANAARRPVILVLLTGGPVDVTFAKDNPKIGAILWAGYPGQAGGLAIAKVLFGDHNPSGRLPVTWYPEEFTKVPMTDMRMRADPATGYPGRSYRFYQGNTVYNFGYGLSYSKFSRRMFSSFSTSNAGNLSLLAGVTARRAGDDGGGMSSYLVKEIGVERCSRLVFPAVVEVQNHGPMDGKHSVLMYLRWPTTSGGRPARQLIGFRSQHVKVGEKAMVSFEVSPCEHFSWVGEDGERVIDGGAHFLMVGDEELETSFGLWGLSLRNRF